MTQQVATFYLDTYSSISEVGPTWHNINLRTILGDMWDKYDLFNLSLVELCTSKCETIDDPDDLSLKIMISGLPFVNTGYDVATAHLTNKTLLTTLKFISDDCLHKQYNGINKLTFSKNQEQCTIEMTYVKIVGNTVVDYDSYADVTFMFCIEGVHLDKDTNTE
jgi:hypothetical protein